METITEIWGVVLAYGQDGFNSVNNKVLGLIIAVAAAFMMTSWGRILVFSLGAVIVHIVVEALLPVVQGAGSFQLPPLMESSFWQGALTLLIGYFIVITVFYILKSLFLRR